MILLQMQHIYVPNGISLILWRMLHILILLQMQHIHVPNGISLILWQMLHILILLQMQHILQACEMRPDCAY